MHSLRKRRRTATLVAAAVSIAALSFAAAANAQTPQPQTASPIKHVVIIVGENRSFDHIFATYVPENDDQRVLNLLSQGIVNADGTPGRNFAKAHQFQITSAPNLNKYFISAGLTNKALYAMLPPPDIGGVPAVSPLAFILGIPAAIPACRRKASSCSAPAERVSWPRSAPTRASATSIRCRPGRSS
jgi:phospholipase C